MLLAGRENPEFPLRSDELGFRAEGNLGRVLGLSVNAGGRSFARSFACSLQQSIVAVMTRGIQMHP